MALKKLKHTRRRIGISSVLKGDENISHFLWERKWFIVFLVGLGIVYMSHGNAVKKTARRQQALRDTLATLKAEAMAASAELLRIGSLPEIKKEVARRNLNLAEPAAPPVVIKMDND